MRYIPLLILVVLSHAVFAQGTLKRFDTSKLTSKNDSVVNSLIAKKVQVSVSFGKSHDFDEVAYNKDRKLTISDFRGTQSNNPLYGGVTYCFISTYYKYHVQDSVIYLDVIVTPLFIKSKSYYQLELRTYAGYNALAHAQMLFDIVAIKACELTTAIKNYTFSPEHFKDELSELKNKYQQENGEERKKLYDDTRRGTYRFAEYDWERKINALLKNQSCY